jgi:hypothetical protein
LSGKSKSNESQRELPTLGSQAIQYKGTGSPGGVESMTIASQIGVLIKAQNRRIRQTCKELLDCPEDAELCEQLRTQALARDVLIEVLSAYFDHFDNANDGTEEEDEPYHPFSV